VLGIKSSGNGENGEYTSEVIEFCRHVAGKSKIAAIAQVDNYSPKPPNERMISEVMVVIHDFPPRIMSYLKSIGNKTVFIFAVNQWIFERDVDRGFLGESIASKLIFPYRALQGGAYLYEREVELKRRLVLELLENLVINFPELAISIQILPQYFLYEVFSSRIRVFPLLAYDLADLTSCLIQNEEQTLLSYNIALKQLKSEGKISLQDGYIHVTKQFINQCQDPKLRIINLSKKGPRTLFTSLFGVLPQLMSIVSQNTEAFLKTQKISWLRQPNQTCRSIDSQKYVFFPTAQGLVSLSDKIDIKGFTQKILLKGHNTDIEVEPIGGMLNDVYLINAGGRKVLAKRFKDWSGFKWFPLTLWSFGARSFSVSGQARLAKECAIGEFLLNEGFNVPKILHVSNAERIIFMEFIEGESLSQAIKQYGTDEAGEDVLELVGKVGEILARVHRSNVSLGDTKPDNILIKPDGSIFLIDFEQAVKGGDKAWDIAVFLYYCGHYLQPFDSNTKAQSIVIAFIEGYLRGGGNVGDIHKAGVPKYTRVFSIFTMPATILAISKVCKQAESGK
jgi:tRNA A-37 threonylcarbamoyl transferase component Bud32